MTVPGKVLLGVQAQQFGHNYIYWQQATNWKLASKYALILRLPKSLNSGFRKLVSFYGWNKKTHSYLEITAFGSSLQSLV